MRGHLREPLGVPGVGGVGWSGEYLQVTVGNQLILTRIKLVESKQKEVTF